MGRFSRHCNRGDWKESRNNLIDLDLDVVFVIDSQVLCYNPPGHRTSWGILSQTPVFLASLGALSLVELDHCSE
jgi:hypothetical protein